MNARGTRKFFGLSIGGCLAFLILSVAAMIVFPGGTIEDPAATHYQFFYNPFSDLGRTRTFDGRSNVFSMALFMSAMLGGAMGLGGFFVGFGRTASASKLSRTLSLCGGLFGIISTVCFLGVAFTPWDLYMHLHMTFVFGAFRSLLIATVLDLLAVLADGTLSYRLLVPFAIFICLLIGYIILLTAGQSAGAMSGPLVQTTGQKLIVYSAILMVMSQSILIRRMQQSETLPIRPLET